MRMDKDTIPRQTMVRRGNKNVLYKNIMKKLGGKKGAALNEKESKVRMALCMGRNINTDAAKQIWKTKVKRMLAIEYTNWVNLMQREAVSDTNRRNLLDLNKYFAEKRGWYCILNEYGN